MRERSRGCISLANSRYPEGFNFGRSNRREGFPDGSVVKSPPANAGAVSPISWVGKSSEEGKATHSSILPWKSQGQGSLAGYSPWGRKELNST